MRCDYWPIDDDESEEVPAAPQSVPVIEHPKVRHIGFNRDGVSPSEDDYEHSVRPG